MLIDNIGTIRREMAQSLITGKLTTLAVALNTPFAEVFLPHSRHNNVLPVPPDSPKYLKPELPGFSDEPISPC